MGRSDSQYGGATGRVVGGMRLRSCSHRTLDGVTFRSGISYPADDPIVRKYRFHFRVAVFPPNPHVEASPEPEVDPEVEPEPESPPVTPADLAYRPKPERLGDPDE